MNAFNFLSGGKITIVLIVIILALTASFSVTVIVYKADIKTLKSDLKQEQLQGILLQDSLQRANSAIDKQNRAIEEMKITTENAKARLKYEIDNISLQRQALIEKAEKSITQDNSCENKLKLINDTQLRFLDER